MPKMYPSSKRTILLILLSKKVQSNAFKESWSIKVTIHDSPTKYIVIFRMINKVTDLTY